MNRDTIIAAPSMPTWLVLSASVLALAIGVGISFQGAWQGSPEMIIATNGARWVMGISVGALLGLAGATSPIFFRDRASPPIVLAVSSGAAIGCALGFTLFGNVGLMLGGLAGAGLFYGVTSTLHLRTDRGMHYLTCFAMLLMLVAGAYANTLTQVAYGLPRDLTWWLLGDVGHAQWASALFVLSVVVGLLLAAWKNLSRRWLGWLATTMAVIAAGPIAFISWFAFCAVQSRSGEPWRSHLLAALVGAAVLLTVDSVQRTLIGPYAFGLNVPIALLGVPLYLFWGRRSS
ncbi:MAG: iron chelate uptake ABC transporter family permease subunit [Gammaproteobacteria bacterium]|nr:iron chelate uptake ABC transporter family permease subunit [Gammaproteobacteria bacterium]